MSSKEMTSVSIDRVEEMVKAAGLTLVPKSAFNMVMPPGVGPDDSKRCAHLAIAKTKKVSRVYVYYAQPDHPGILKRDEEYRKEMRYGGIMAEVDFTKPEDVVFSAIETCLQTVKNATPPAAEAAEEKGEKPARKPRAKKAKPEAEAAPADGETEATAS